VIVADTNVIVALMLPSQQTAQAERLYGADPDWIAPLLWRSEMRNVLTLYLRKSLISLDQAVRVQTEAESFLQDREYEVDSQDVLTLAGQGPCSAYDCEFVALARSFGVKLVTLDRRVIAAFPETVLQLDAFGPAGS
jgi:predicted nucleic acid-binding protein